MNGNDKAPRCEPETSLLCYSFHKDKSSGKDDSHKPPES
jgi:hypothetical protein